MKFLNLSQAPVTGDRAFLDARARTYCQHLKKLSYKKRIPIENVRFKYGYFKSPAQADADPAPWQPYQNGQQFGWEDAHAFFTFDVQKPADFETAWLMVKGGCVPEFTWPKQREGQILFVDGETQGESVQPHLLLYAGEQIVQGMDQNHQCVPVPELADGAPVRLSLAAYIPRGSAVSHLCIELVSIDQPLIDLYYDLLTPLETAECVGADTPAAQGILRHLDAAVSEIDLTAPYSESFYDSIARAQRYMTEEFYGKACHPSEDCIVSTIGHTHIDVAWKWTVGQTREKVVRSFSTVLRMMEQYPEYRFTSSQPQLYQFLKEEAPALYEQVKQRVKEGRWECEGAMWLEPDTNIPSGESLVRQLLYGTRFFREEFGAECDTLWLPDVFGYSASLPQILKKSGIHHFATAKLGWNQFNLFPYTTFDWVGMDGSSVLVQLITTSAHNETVARTTYNGMLGPSHVLGSQRRHAQKDLHRNTLCPYGHGDGGGGPTLEMVEKNRRMMRGIPALPTTVNTTVHEYFETLDKTLEGKQVPRWKGELYFECHRGTYTSIAEIKKNNRRTERLLGAIECLAANDPAHYPKATLDEMWRTLLLNQFHDILPGSSIEQVYIDAAAQFAGVTAQGEALLEEQLSRLSGAPANALVLFNTASFDRTEPVFTAEPCTAASQNGKRLPVQPVDGGVLIGGAAVPACGRASVLLSADAPAETAENRLTVTPTHLENDFLSIEVDAFGQFTRIYDKRAHREVLAEGQCGNVLRAYQDLPSRHDNWNIDAFYQRRPNPIVDDCRITVLETGPVRGALLVEKRFGHSTVRQEIRIWAHSAQIDFATTLDWHDQHFMVKADFPIDVLADEMTCDVQFGNIKRSTLKNTSWDLGRFEACSHKWIDLSEEGYGAALLNDCKYGHTMNGSHLELTLLRSGTFPNPHADQGEHTFTYSLLPHVGGWRESGVDQAATALNEPLLTHAGQPCAPSGLLSIDAPNVFVSSIKRAEDSDDLIVRLFENHGRRTVTKISFIETFEHVGFCDMMEHNYEPLHENTNEVQLTLRPYEIVTLKLCR